MAPHLSPRTLATFSEIMEMVNYNTFSWGVSSGPTAGKRLFKTAAVQFILGGKVSHICCFLLPWKRFSTSTSPLMGWVNTLSVISFKYKSHTSLSSRRGTHHLGPLKKNACDPCSRARFSQTTDNRLMKTLKGERGNHANLLHFWASIWAQSPLPSEYSSKVANVQ